MEPEPTMSVEIDGIIATRTDEEIAEYVSDAGILGEQVREELVARGHTVHYNNTNGVATGSVEWNHSSPGRFDSVNPVSDENPLQTTEGGPESVEQIDADRKQHVDDQGATDPKGADAPAAPGGEFTHSEQGPTPDFYGDKDPSARDRGDMGPGA